MVETDTEIESHTTAHAPVILDECLDIGVPIVTDDTAAFGVTIKVAEEGVGIAILRVVGHGCRTAEVIGAQIRAGACRLVLLDLARAFVVESSLDIVLSRHLADRVVKAVDIVEVAVRALSAARIGETGFVRELTAEAEVRDTDLQVL